MKEERLHPVHPGEVLLEEFLKPMHLSQNRLALDIGVHPRRINEIVLGKRSITAETALRLARYLALPRSSGWGCRRITTSTWPWMCWGAAGEGS